MKAMFDGKVREVEELASVLPTIEQGEKYDTGKQDWFLLPLELIEPLAQVMIVGEGNGYGNFSCMKPFDNSSRRFYNGLMRHVKASQQNPLAINHEKGGDCYHLACVAFNALMRLHHAIKEAEATSDVSPFY